MSTNLNVLNRNTSNIFTASYKSLTLKTILSRFVKYVISPSWCLRAVHLTLSQVKHWTRLRMEPSKMSEMMLR